MTAPTRTQVAIVGAGPAGLMLAMLLRRRGIDSVVLERRSRDYVQARIRAGVLEQVTVDLLREVGAAARMDAEGLPHHGFNLGLDGETFRIDLHDLTGGKSVMVYGQTEVTRDLIDAVSEVDGALVWEAEDVTPHDVDTDRPSLTFRTDGEVRTLRCDLVAGCDGFHGPSRGAVPDGVGRTFERVYPFGWLGILADVAPCDEELIYSNHERGFALASMRSPTRSRYYVQVGEDERLDAWPDERIWDELACRLGDAAARSMQRGPSIEKSIAPLRSFVFEPMRWGRLLLAGDAAHIVPPTGAKGLNLAMGDVKLLADAVATFYERGGDPAALDDYSARALRRVWKAERFSWWFTGLTHRFPTMGAFDRRMQMAELSYIRESRTAQAVIAENYVGLPLT